jgi:uncharacterized protein (TIRG00374 family)
MQRFTRFVGYSVVGAFAVVALYTLRADLSQMTIVPLARSWDLVLLAAALSLANYGLRILRWRQYLSRLGHPLPLGFTGLTYVAGFAFTISPGKVGEVARARYYSRVGIPVADVAGAFLVERLMDLLAMLVLGGLILGVAPRYQATAWIAAAIATLVLVSLAVLPWPALGRRISRGTWIPRPVATLCAGIASALSSARALLSPGVLLAGLILGLAAWGCEGLGLNVLSSMFPPAHLDLAVGVGIYAVAVLVGALSFLPGGLGSTEAVMTTLLVTRGFRTADALLITIVCRVLTLWLAVGLGWSAMVALRQKLVEAPASW